MNKALTMTAKSDLFKSVLPYYSPNQLWYTLYLTRLQSSSRITPTVGAGLDGKGDFPPSHHAPSATREGLWEATGKESKSLYRPWTIVSIAAVFWMSRNAVERCVTSKKPALRETIWTMVFSSIRYRDKKISKANVELHPLIKNINSVI